MDYRISDLLDGMEDDSVRLSGIPAVSTERICVITMKKIDNKQPANRTVRRSLRGVWLAAAVAVLLVTAAAAVTILRRIQFHDVAPEEELFYTLPDGMEVSMNSVERYVTLDGVADGAKEVGFQADYLPVERDDMFWGGTLGSRLYDLAGPDGEGYGELLDAAGLSREEAEQWYTTSWCDREDAFLRIDVFTGAQLEGTDLLFDGTVTDAGEGEINGMEAHYLTVEKPDLPEDSLARRQNNILLYSEALHCMVNISGSFGFDELEKVAGGLVLKGTGVDARDTFLGPYSFIGGGVG